MKTKKIYAMIAITLLMCSCEKFAADKDNGNKNVQNSNVSVNVTQDDVVKKVCQKVSFGFFKDEEKIGVVNQTADDKDFGRIHLSLSPGIYSFVAIGHNGTGNCTITSPEKITFTSNKVTDTFSYYGILEAKADESTTESITLKRAVAKFRLVIKDEIPDNAKKIKFYYTGGSSTLNAVTGFGCVNSKQTEIQEMSKGQQVYDVYTFPHEDGRKLTITVSVLDENDFTITSTTFNDVQVIKNYITKYSGKLFGDVSGGGNGNIDIDFEFDPEWAGENEYYF